MGQMSTTSMSRAMRLSRHVLLGAGLLAATAFAADAPIRSAFGPGEQSTFEVSYLGVPTGVAVITVGLKMQQFGKDVWPLVATAETDLDIYPVHDRFVSYWDFTANRNLGSDFVADENKKRRRERFRYDRAQNKVFATKQSQGKPEASMSYDVPEGVVDLCAAAFAVRNRKLAVGDQIQLPIFTGMITYVMDAKVLAREKLPTPMGERDALKVSFTAEWSGGLATRRALTLWFTDDAIHLPVRFEADLVLGTVVAVLKTYFPGKDYTQ